ncbi:MAG: preprotein translocase subunit YajC [Defluviitaleaceae bacterium]|nr:preprotein translocase subunit YajC [Defluviitaleaceae bacterium]
MLNNTVILNGTGTILGHDVAAQPGTAAPGDAPPAQAQAEGGFFGGTTGLILIYVLLFGVIWMLFIRPQKKRQKQQKEMIAALKVGDGIITNSGMFGKIVDIGQDAYVVEFGTSKGIRIPVAKESIAGVREPMLTPAPKV